MCPDFSSHCQKPYVCSSKVSVEKRGLCDDPVKTVISAEYGVKEARDERVLCTPVSQMGMCESL